MTSTAARGVALATLFCLPIFAAAAIGCYHLWVQGWSFVAYWPAFACWVSGYLLARYWTRGFRNPESSPSAEVPEYWTERDRLAWESVEEFARTTPPPPQLARDELVRYAALAQELALKVARVYRPDATDPFGRLTMPEILACAELVANDTARLVDRYVPGSNLLRIDDVRALRSTASHVSRWYPRLQTAYWAISALIDPVRTGARIAASKLGLEPLGKGVRDQLVASLHVQFLREMGRHFVELQSGRLRVGAEKWRLLREKHLSTQVVPDTELPEVLAPEVVVAILGPVKSGKSSLVNALLGERRAATDVLPTTATQSEYRLRESGRPPLTLVDSAGFGQSALESDAELAAAVELAERADLIVFVVPARSAARKQESEFLASLEERRRMARGNRKAPPLVVVLSHMDLLTPAREWSPPYEWESGTRLKEQSIRESVVAAREVFGRWTDDFVPVCLLEGRIYGVEDELAGLLAERLDVAKGVAFLRALHEESLRGRARKVWDQLKNIAGGVLNHMAKRSGEVWRDSVPPAGS